MSPRPILLLSAGRAGTNLLRSFFRPREKLLDIREFLNPAAQAHDRRYAFWSPDNPGFAERLAATRPDPRGPNDVFDEYTAWLMREAGERRLFADLKYHHVGPVDALWRYTDAAPPPLASFLRSGASVIHLVRRNPLALLCSIRLALQTNNWVRFTGGGKRSSAGTQPGEAAGLLLETGDLVSHLRRIELRTAVAAVWLERHARQVTLHYEDLLEGDQLAGPVRDRLAALIGSDIDFSGTAGTQKIAPPLTEVIANLDEVHAALRDSEFAWCLGATLPEQTGHTSPVAASVTAGALASRISAVPATADRSRRETVLLCRELPAYLGRDVDLAAIAERLAAAGFETLFALPGAARRQRGAGDFAAVPGPVWPALAARAVAAGPREHAELLAAIGFTDAAAVAGMQSAWRALIEAVRPAAIVADQCPGLVATGAAGSVPVIAVGTPASLPPITPHGFPLLISLRRSPPPIAQMLASLRAIGRKAETNDAAGFASLLDTPHRLVFGLPELDPYHWSREEALVAPPEASAPFPPRSEIRRLLAVLPPGLRGGTLEAAILAADPRARIVDEPIEIEALRRALPEASHVLCLTSGAASKAAFCAGHPQLLILDGPDADMTARLVEQQLVGRRIDPKASAAVLSERISTFLVDMYLAENALLVAGRIAGREQAGGLDAVASLVAEVTPPAYAGGRTRRERAPTAQPS